MLNSADDDDDSSSVITVVGAGEGVGLRTRRLCLHSSTLSVTHTKLEASDTTAGVLDLLKRWMLDCNSPLLTAVYTAWCILAVLVVAEASSSSSV